MHLSLHWGITQPAVQVSPMYRGWRGVRLGSVDPADRHPLRRGAHLLYGLLQRAYRVLDVIVHNFEVEVVSVGLLQQFTLAGQALQAAILKGIGALMYV